MAFRTAIAVGFVVLGACSAVRESSMSHVVEMVNVGSAAALDFSIEYGGTTLPFGRSEPSFSPKEVRIFSAEQSIPDIAVVRWRSSSPDGAVYVFEVPVRSNVREEELRGRRLSIGFRVSGNSLVVDVDDDPAVNTRAPRIVFSESR
jgi:hypothetical protein